MMLPESENVGMLTKVTATNLGTATVPLGGRAGSAAVNGEAGAGHKRSLPLSEAASAGAAQRPS